MIELEVRGLKQGFLVVGRFPEREYDLDKLEAKLRAAVVEGLPKRRIWKLFQRTEVDLKSGSPELSDDKAEVEVDEISAKHLEEQARRGNESVKDLRTTLEAMKKAILETPIYDHSLLSKGASFLSSCLSASGNGFMYLWCDEKLAYIRSGLADLAKRQNFNHPNYQRTAQNIHRWLSSWPIANVWTEEPPRLPSNA